MKKIIEGVLDFKENSLEEYRNKFSHLASGQSPEVLFVSCCDSRVVPNIFTEQNPGDIFVLRNMGNIIPPYQTEGDCSVAATLEYAVLELKVKDIVICGHSECGAMATALEKELPKEYMGIKKWLEYVRSSQQKLQKKSILDNDLTEQNNLSQINVVQQLENLKTYPYIAEGLQNGSLEIHGWWFELKTADIYCYKPEDKKFVLIDKK